MERERINNCLQDSETLDSGIPEQITINRKFASNYLLIDSLAAVPYDILFENKTDFESFMLFHLEQFEDRECEINIENLKLYCILIS